MEVLVATTILSLVILALVTALRTFGQTQDSVEQRVDRISALRETNYLLRHLLREMVPLETSAFSVGNDQLIWLAPFDRAGAAGGLVWLRLSLVGQDLALDFAPLLLDDERNPDASQKLWGEIIEREVILEGVKNLDIDARSAADTEWLPQLGDALDNAQSDVLAKDGVVNTVLPQAVRIFLDLDTVPWPPLVVAMDAYAPEKVLD